VKDRANLAKHGLSLDLARHIDFSRTLVIPDTRTDYGEDRFIGYGPLDGILHVLVFTMRGDVMRVIGLRRANKRERKKYETHTF
jgi:uncharacterized protein